MKEQRRIYLMSPFSHKDETVKQLNYWGALVKTRTLMRAGHTVFSPIVYGYFLAKDKLIGDDAGYWRTFNLSMIDWATEGQVLALNKWEESKGIKEELSYFGQNGKPIELIYLTSQEQETISRLFCTGNSLTKFI